VNGYSFDHVGSGKASNHPVHSVNWYDCVKWCNARSQMAGKTPCYNLSTWSCNYNANGYRLPTMDEWEYAARGGLSSKRFPWGDNINHNHANYKANGLAYPYDTSSYTNDTFHPSYDEGDYPYTSPVESFSSNGYGLYDMSGNVWEWCNTASGSYRPLRGGSWYNTANYAHCGYEYRSSPGREAGPFGLRAVCR
jgi:sulfatase modifying factor 1